jgi:hypothetical protein
VRKRPITVEFTPLLRGSKVRKMSGSQAILIFTGHVGHEKYSILSQLYGQLSGFTYLLLDRENDPKYCIKISHGKKISMSF